MCLKTSASRLPPRGSWPKGPERARDGIPAANGRQFLQRPLTAVAELSRGRAFLLMDRVICPEYLFVSQSHMCLKTCTSRLPLGEAGCEADLKGRDGIPAANGRLSLYSPSHRCRGVPGGRACLLTVFFIFPGHILSISLICALCSR